MNINKVIEVLKNIQPTQYASEDRFAYYDKVKNAVYSTKGQYLTYNGKYIDALYFSTSNGRTENAENVWSTAYPYLVSVESPWDVGIPSYSGSKSIPMSDSILSCSSNLPSESPLINS